jgi:hypothetical protein
MKTKLQLYTLALCLGLLGFVSITRASNSTYTYTGAGHPELTSNWKKQPGGTVVASFTVNNQTFLFKNVGAATLGAAWTVSGTGSKVTIGDATNAFSLSDGGFKADFSGASGGCTVSNLSTLIISNSSSVFGTLNFSPGSTANYATTAGSQTVFANLYYNLIISGSAAMQLSGSSSVSTVLTVNAGLSLNLGGATLSLVSAVSTLNAGSFILLNGGTLNFSGTSTLVGSGTITGDNSAILNTSTTGSLGTINFTAGGRVLSDLSINSGSIILGSDLLISGGGGGSIFNQASGSINLNSHTLTLDNDCDVTFGSSSANVITGSATSSIKIYSNATAGGFVEANSLYMDQTTSGSTNALSNLTMNDSSSAYTLTLGSTLDIIDSISPKSGTISSGGNLTLIADQATVGHVGRVSMVGATGALSGNITSQVYYDPSGFKTNWALLGTSGLSNARFADWGSSFMVTCPSGCSGDGSAQNNGVPFTSVTTFDEPTDTYPNITTGNSTINPGTGYWVYLGTASPSSASAPILITLTGTPVIGDLAPINLTNSGAGADNGYNLVANPYPSPIFWKTVYTDNSASGFIGGTIYLYSNANQNYATLNQSGAFTNSGSYDVSSGLIPTGEAFYMFTSANTTLTFKEDQKGQGTQALGRSANQGSNSVQSSTTTPFFQIDVVNVHDTLMSEVAVSFDPNGTLGTDKFDGVARPWDNRLQISTGSLGTFYTINGLPDFSQNYSLPVRILSKTTTQYTISAKNLQKIPTGPCLTLHDKYGIMPDHDLRAGSFIVTVNDTETVARFVLNITTSPLAVTTNAVNASCHAKNDGFITAVGNDAGPWNYTWKNASGTIVKTSLNKPTADTLTGLNNGVYSVDVTTVGGCNSATHTFTIVAPASAVSAFTASAQINMGDNANLVNNSTNATNYIWNFGNGDISSMQTPSYVYNNSGTFTITLYAINANCNDTAKFKQVITVNATTSIKQANTGNGDINLSRDGSGNYIQFDYTDQTKVSITVYNVLGQAVLTNAALNVVNDKIYINIADYKNQVLYVSITNLTTNKQTTKKFVND